MKKNNFKHTFAKLPNRIVETNISQGSYKPAFFNLENFSVSKVDYNSLYFNQGDAERYLLKGESSFYFLREDKLRTIDAYDDNGNHIEFRDFLNHFGISIQSKNLFKTGKYLSRVFRPVRFGNFFKGLMLYINTNSRYSGKVTDGISLISIDLAHALGWENAKAGMSAQFTLFYKNGLVKGHCVISDKI